VGIGRTKIPPWGHEHMDADSEDMAPGHGRTGHALITSNGLLSAGAFRALRESSLKMPEEIALASFDETPWSNLVDPPFTVIEQPTYHIGRTGIESPVNRIQDPRRPTREVTLKGRLIVRRFCGRQE